jgi:hypothetical protein
MDGWIKGLLILGLGVAGGIQHFKSRPIKWQPGTYIDSEPIQKTILNGKTWEYNGFTFRPLATYDIRARIVQRQRYYFDPTSSISPLDLGLAWGKVTDQASLDKMSFTHNDRFLSGSSQDPDFCEKWDSISNVHLIPSDKTIQRQLLGLKVGQGVRLKGKLVSATQKGSENAWTSSLTRTDAGDGACEIMWVEEVNTIEESQADHDKN